ncbi:MAG: hypothetical protein LBV72_05075 [Tannerella sp.]|nr:hypothetical protein [Tannerella sp.]
MKKFISILLASTFLLACGTYKTLDLGTLTFGMTTQEVIRLAGKPQRVLSVRNTPDGRQEVLEYQTTYREVYALEFWNDYLTGYEYLYDDVTYVIPPHPPVHYPEYGRPIYIYPNTPPDRPGLSNQPGRPNRPTQPERPSQPSRPSQPGRPISPGRPETPSQPSRPNQPERPSQPSRPNRPDQSTPTRPGRPAQSETPSRGESTRPADTNQRQSSRGESNSGEKTSDKQESTRSPSRAGGR